MIPSTSTCTVGLGVPVLYRYKYTTTRISVFVLVPYVILSTLGLTGFDRVRLGTFTGYRYEYVELLSVNRYSVRYMYSYKRGWIPVPVYTTRSTQVLSSLQSTVQVCYRYSRFLLLLSRSVTHITY